METIQKAARHAHMGQVCGAEVDVKFKSSVFWKYWHLPAEQEAEGKREAPRNGGEFSDRLASLVARIGMKFQLSGVEMWQYLMRNIPACFAACITSQAEKQRMGIATRAVRLMRDIEVACRDCVAAVATRADLAKLEKCVSAVTSHCRTLSEEDVNKKLFGPVLASLGGAQESGAAGRAHADVVADSNLTLSSRDGQLTALTEMVFGSGELCWDVLGWCAGQQPTRALGNADSCLREVEELAEVNGGDDGDDLDDSVMLEASAMDIPIDPLSQEELKEPLVKYVLVPFQWCCCRPSGLWDSCMGAFRRGGRQKALHSFRARACYMLS